MQVDAGVRLDQPGAEAGGVRLDQRHTHAVAVDGAEVGRVTVAAGAQRSEARSVSIMSTPPTAIAPRAVAVGGVAEHVGSVEPGGGGSLDQQVGEAHVVGVGRQVQPAGQFGCAQREVALRVRWDGPAGRDAERAQVSGVTQSAIGVVRSASA